MYETFDHTADLGLRIRADHLEGLFEEAGRALLSVMVTRPSDVRAVEEVAFEVEGTEHDELLRDWLAELLYTFHGRHLLLAEFDVRLGPTGLTATARGEPFDPNHHEIDAELKAITYHGLKVQQHPDGWLAEVIVDI